MIAKTFFLAKIIYLIGAQNLRDKKTLPVTLARYWTFFALRDDPPDAVLVFRHGSRRPPPRLDIMEGLTKAELNEMISEAIIDANGEEEQLMGFAVMIEDSLEVPFQTTVLGVKVTVEHVTQRSHGLVASCVRGQHRQAIHVLDLPLPEPPPKGAEWIAAYRHWMR